MSSLTIALTKLVVKDTIVKITISDTSRKESDINCRKLQLKDVLILLERLTGKYWTLDNYDSVFIGHNLVSLNGIVVDRYEECYNTFDLGKEIESHDFTEFEELCFTPDTAMLVKESVTAIDSDYVWDDSDRSDSELSPGFGVDTGVKDTINSIIVGLYAQNIEEQLERYPRRKPVRRLGTVDILSVLALDDDIYWLFDDYNKTFEGYDLDGLKQLVYQFAEDGISLSDEIEEAIRVGFGDYYCNRDVLKLIREIC